jgi:adenylate cyclase
MEVNTAILIADLSGYTALTETHGAFIAADLIEKYTEVINKSLAGDSTVHQYTGDEVVIVSTSADDLASTATLMMHNTAGEKDFLLVHGGLHFGKLLKRNNNYFGTTINYASRIANTAQPGKFWCSPEFINAITDKSRFSFESRGLHTFKNLNGKSELHELKIDLAKDFYIDPVCRMVILDPDKALCHPDGPVYFCSDDCYSAYMNRK